jgi:hypothetical protein
MASHDDKVMSDDIYQKQDVTLKENIDGSQDGSPYECEFTEREQRKIIHRIDRRLVVTVGVLYCISLMDRTNLSAAAIAGMTVELKLVALEGTISRYSVVTIVFFASYIIFQPPATVICRYLGPRNFLSFIVVAWGAVMIGMGFADSYGAMAGLRVLLGVLEAGFFPSCVYLLSTWCKDSIIFNNRRDTDHFFRYPVRHWKAVLVLLHLGQFGFCLCRYPCIWTDAAEGTRGSERLALDLHHRRSAHLLPWYRRLLGPRRLPRQGPQELEFSDRERSQVHHRSCQQGPR